MSGIQYHKKSFISLGLLLSEVTQERPEYTDEVMGLDNERKREIDTILLVPLQRRLRRRTYSSPYYEYISI